MNDAHLKNIKAVYEYHIPSPSTINQELRLLTRYWANEKNKLVNVRYTLKQLSSHGFSENLYSNIVVILRVLLTIPAIGASAERANFALKFVKNFYRSKMSEDRLNSLILMYVHKDIKLDYNDIIHIYARRSPRTMLFINPLCNKQLISVRFFVVLSNIKTYDIGYSLIGCLLQLFQCWFEKNVAIKNGETFRMYRQFSIKNAAQFIQWETVLICLTLWVHFCFICKVEYLLRTCIFVLLGNC